MAVGPKSVSEGHKYLNGPYTFIELNTGHWIIQTAYFEVAEAVKKHVVKFKG